MLFDHEPLLIDYMLRRQHKVDDQHHDMPLFYYMEGHNLHFGRREFSLIISFRFGTDEEMFSKLSDDDAIRLCLLLALEIWILETFERCESWWIKDPKVIPRALGWSKKSLFTTSDYSYIFSKESRSTSDLRPTIAEKNWLNDLVIMELNFCLFKLETIIQVLAHERSDRQAKLKFTDEFSIMTSDLCDSLNSMFADFIEPADPDEDIAQDYLREEELRLFLEGEEKMRCEHQKLIVDQNRIRLDEAKRLRLKEKNMLQLEQQKKNKRKEFMNSSHCKILLSKLPPAKRIQLCSSSEKIKHKVSWVKIKKYCQQVYDPCTAEFLKNVKPYVEDTSRVLQSIDTVWLSDDIERFLGQSGQIKYPAMKGWLTKETCGWTICGMSDPRILIGLWLVVTLLRSYCKKACPYFMLMRRGIPLYGARLIRSNVVVESVRLLQKFQQDGLESSRGMMMLIYETQIKVQLPVVLECANIFQKNEIDPSKYTITFRLADNVPKQWGIYGDCGVWVCILLYRLAHGFSLDVDDPVDIALAYREKMVPFF
nr:phospholipase-like protein [Tanacetum cinerariifolium]